MVFRRGSGHAKKLKCLNHPYKNRKPMKLKGSPIKLNTYEVSEMLTNRYFKEFKMDEFEKIHLPESMIPFTDLAPRATKEFVADDNRGAVSPLPSLKMDGTDYYLSVKGIGSTTNPFSHQ